MKQADYLREHYQERLTFVRCSDLTMVSAQAGKKRDVLRALRSYDHLKKAADILLTMKRLDCSLSNQAVQGGAFHV